MRSCRGGRLNKMLSDATRHVRIFRHTAFLKFVLRVRRMFSTWSNDDAALSRAGGSEGLCHIPLRSEHKPPPSTTFIYTVNIDWIGNERLHKYLKLYFLFQDTFQVFVFL